MALRTNILKYDNIVDEITKYPNNYNDIFPTNTTIKIKATLRADETNKSMGNTGGDSSSSGNVWSSIILIYSDTISTELPLVALHHSWGNRPAY